MKIGIDLGTSYSLASRMHPDGSTSLVHDFRDQERVHTPSVALITGGSAYVGAIAEDMAEAHPELPVIRFFKRNLGERDPIYYDDGGFGWHAEGVAALVLDKLRFDTETEVSRKVDGAVITVPAHFTDNQRKAVAAAAMLAELPLAGLIEEPVAAAMHYGVSTEAHKKILLAYDFGGGTFDATVMSLDANGIYVLGKRGVTDLGGKELDEKVGEMVLDQFEAALRRRPNLNARTLLELRRASEAIKIELCAPGTRAVRKMVLLGRDPVEVRIEKAQFEKAISEYIERTVAVTVQCLQDAGLSKKDVDTVLLVGGSSLVPAVVDQLKKALGAEGKEMLYHEPSKAVALGAALRAAQIEGLASEFRLPAELKGVSSYAVGVRTVDPTSGRIAVDTLIKKSMPLPMTAKKVYYTTRPDQASMLLDFVQHTGDGGELIPLGQLRVGPLDQPQVNYPISVRVEYKEDGTVHVVASDANTGEELEQSFGGDPTGDIQYLSAQRKLLQSILMTRP